MTDLDLTVRDKIKLKEPLLLFRSTKPKPHTITLSKEGRYIHAQKDNKRSKTNYSFDLKDGVFIKHEKNKKDRPIKSEKITGWFYGNDIITNDYKFGLLILYNKYYKSPYKYRSVVRFIEQLADDRHMNYEKWISIGVNFEETNTLLNKINDGVHITTEMDKCFRTLPAKAPSNVDKNIIKIAKEREEISIAQLNSLIANYSPEKTKILTELLEYEKQEEYEEIFTVPRYEWQGTILVSMLTDPQKSFNRNKLLDLIVDYNLQLDRFVPYLKEIKNYEHTNLNWVVDNYEDYLQAELYLRGGKLRKVNKYPNNLVQAHHNRTSVVQDIEREKRRQKDIEERKREKEIYNSYKHLKEINKNKKYSIIVPNDFRDVIDEGTRMGHCVGGYVGRIAEGKTFIIFMRKTEKLSSPFITVEVSNGKLCTALGRHNRRLEKNERIFLEQYASRHDLEYTAYPKLL